MKRIVTVYGLISGAIVSTLMILSMQYMRSQGAHSQYGMLIGYASMFLAFCLIFVGVRNYRDRHLGGYISFGKAFTTGLWIALIASVCYTIAWIIFYKGFYPDFMDLYTKGEMAAMQKSGKSPAEIATATKEMESMMRIYNTWPGLIGMTLIEILPPGILVSLISALILRRKQRVDVNNPQLA
jgi:hypothetical protein